MRGSVLFKFGRLAARFERWTPAVAAMARVAGLSQADLFDRLRFSYAGLMARKNPAARRAFLGLLRREEGRSLTGDLWLAYTAWCFGKYRLNRQLNLRAARRWSDTASADDVAIALHQAAFARMAVEGKLAVRVEAAISAAELPRPSALPLILVPVSSRYGKLFELWAEQVRKYLPGVVVLLAMDSAVAEVASLHGFHAIALESFFSFASDGRIDEYSKRQLWVLRVLVLQHLLALGHTIVSLDLDALPVGPVAPMLAALPGADIVAQRDFSIPVDAARRLGFILCCGFMVFRPTAATLALFRLYAPRTLLELDDQTALNHLLVEAGVHEKHETATHLSFAAADCRFVCPDASLVSRSLDSGSVIRHFHQGGLTTDDLRQRLELGPAAAESQFASAHDF